MFGYKLMLVKKSELQEDKVFRNSVFQLIGEIDRFGDFISNGFDLNADTTAFLTEINSTIGVYVDMYFSCKYSSPSNSLSMYTNMDRVRKDTLTIIDTITEYNKLLSVKKKYDATCEQLGDAYSECQESLAIQSELYRGFQEVTQAVGHACASILNALFMLHQSVNGDKLRIEAGYDFKKEYKKRLKRIPKDDNLMSEFTVKYTLNTRADKEYLLKEKVRNERRSRTRTSDGGNEKAV
jgi:hypothetical protein